MWTAITRAEHRRDAPRIPSDLTDAEWAVLEPLLPAPSRVGRRPCWPMREILNAIFYVLRGGVPLRMLPDCSPPRQTVYGWFAAFRYAGVWETLNHHLVVLDRERAGREARCLIPGFGGAVFSQAWKDALWARFFTVAPPRQRRSVARSSIVKRA